jgi:hypothetical protein
VSHKRLAKSATSSSFSSFLPSSSSSFSSLRARGLSLGDCFCQSDHASTLVTAVVPGSGSRFSLLVFF